MPQYQTANAIASGKTIFDLPLRVTYYGRVSSDKDEQLNSLDNQITFFEDYIKKNENWTYVQGYVDEGISGFSAHKRKSFMQMIEDSGRGKFDLIVTKEISRFARNIIDSIQYTRQLLLQDGVGVFFLNDGINTFDKDSELRLTIMSGIAQDELRKLSERVNFGHREAIKKGVIYGQSNLVGYDRLGGQLVINEAEAETVRRTFEIYAEGKLGIRSVARQLEREGHLASNGRMYQFATIANWIKNPKYKGYYAANKYYTTDYRDPKKHRNKQDEWIVYKDERIPAIVSEELWDYCNELYSIRSEKLQGDKKSFQNRYTYSGKIICGEHGTAYHRHVYKSKRRGEQECWNCKLYRLKGKEEGCDSPTLYSSELNEILSDIYGELYINRDEVIDNLAKMYEDAESSVDIQSQISRLEGSISMMDKKKEALLELLVEGIIDKQEFKGRNDTMAASISENERQIDQLKEKAKDLDSGKRKINQLRRILNSEWKNTSTDKITEKILDRIVVHKEGDKEHLRLEIYLKMGNFFEVSMAKGKVFDYSILLNEVGISQAQVSRVEKHAINQIKKNI